MRGIIFTELLEMAESRFGYQMVDKVLQEADLQSGGVYTSVGTYPHEELVELLKHFSKETALNADELECEYGEHLFTVLVKSYPDFFEYEDSALSFLSRVESKIHPQVLKLYPDAKLPTFEIESHKDDKLVMMYHSSRKMSSFAKGLIKGCLSYFKEQADIEVADLTGNGDKVRFTINKRA